MTQPRSDMPPEAPEGGRLQRSAGELYDTSEAVTESYARPDATPQPWQPARVGEKSVVLSIVLAVLVPGLGHIYLRRFAQGVAILVIVVVLLFLFFLIITLVAAAIIWIWQIYDAYRTANEFNRTVRATGARPW